MPRWIHDEISQQLKRLIVLPGVAPGASVCVGRRIGRQWRYVDAVAGTLAPGGGLLVNAGTPYDLASLTKPLLAATVARLVAAGKLTYVDPLYCWIPELKGTAGGEATVEQLLSHRAGLKAHIVLDPTRLEPCPMPPEASQFEMLAACANSVRPECQGPLGLLHEPLYSDLGYILVGHAVSTAEDQPLDCVMSREVFQPLGTAVSSSGPSPFPQSNAVGLGSAAQWVAAAGQECFTARVAPTEVLSHRGGMVRGQVHDDNAWWLCKGGIAGHAGAFGQARGVALFGAAVMDSLAGHSEDWLNPGAASHLVAPRPGGSLRAGFDSPAATGSSAGTRFGPNAFGHLGFTGTSLWCSLEPSVVVVLLTNRVCPDSANISIRQVRPEVHSSLFDWATQITS